MTGRVAMASPTSSRVLAGPSPETTGELRLGDVRHFHRRLIEAPDADGPESGGEFQDGVQGIDRAALNPGPADLHLFSASCGQPPDGSADPDFETQVRLAFANLEATLVAGGCGFDDIVDVMTFHTDPDRQLTAVMAVKGEVFKSAPYPTERTS
jgi:hypothetical protein